MKETKIAVATKPEMTPERSSEEAQPFRKTRLGRRITAPLALCRRLNDHLKRLLRRSRLEVWRVEGKEKTTQLPLTLILAGRAQNKSYVLELIFGESFQEHFLGRFLFWKIPRLIQALGKECSMVLINVPRDYLGRLPMRNYFFVPNWLLGRAPLPRDKSVINNPSLKDDYRRIRKYGYQFETTKDPRLWADFHRGMHVPYIQKAYGDTATITSLEEIMANAANTELLLLKSQGRSIAGMLIVFEQPCPRLWSVGIRDANLAFLKEGALAACFHFAMQHLEQKGFAAVTLGWSRPLLDDGALRFKNKLGQRFVEGANAGFAFHVGELTPATRAFLAHNPFIFQQDGLLCAAVFVDRPDPLTADDFHRLKAEYLRPGIPRLSITRMDSNPATPGEIVPLELADHISFRRVTVPGNLFEDM